MENRHKSSLKNSFIFCAVVSLLTIWLHRYPAGIDLPQHANVFAIWAKLIAGEEGYNFFYRTNLFTPYLLTYALASPLALLFGALIATKIVISVIVLATPYFLMRWLRHVGGEPWFGLWGFLIAFGFAYFWGFTSFSMSLPFMFIYLMSVEQLNKVTLKRVMFSAGLSILLFFCHAITFGVASLIAGLRCFRKGDRDFILRGLHFIPSTILFFLWFQNRQRDGQVLFAEWPPNPSRLLTVFSGLFSANNSYMTVIAGFVIFIFVALMTRSKLSNHPGRFLPLMIGSLGFLFLPETMASTWLVGTRFVVFVHAFMPLAFSPTVVGKKITYMRASIVSIIVVCLITLNVRLFGFNRELSGMDKVVASMPVDADLHGLLVDTGWHSEWVGDAQMGQVMAWVTAERGGVLENDQARYFPIPIQRRTEYPWQRHYRNLLARGPSQNALALASRFEPAPKVVSQKDNWVLIESGVFPMIVGDVEVVRSAQQWGELQLNRSVTGDPLSIAGTPYLLGLGTCPKSIIQIRPVKAGKFLQGKVGINDKVNADGSAVFKILDLNKNEIFNSGSMNSGMPAKEFIVPLNSMLFLITEPVQGKGIDSAYANWLEMTVAP